MAKISNAETYIAHVRKRGHALQSVEDHLCEVAEIAKRFGSKVNLSFSGELLGLVHDLGKYSSEFQRYIRGAAGLSDSEEEKQSKEQKGKIDHSTAGAQRIWTTIRERDPHVAEILAACVIGHHGGLPDLIGPESRSPFLQRMNKSKDKTFLDEVLENGDNTIITRIEELLSSDSLVEELTTYLKGIYKSEGDSSLCTFHCGLLTRLLFSCLVDADRLSAANFDSPVSASFRREFARPDWESLLSMLENYLTGLPTRNDVDKLRSAISKRCFEAASCPKGVVTLNVPTGGGKTLAGLRFAFQHARHHAALDPSAGFERIIYVLPYTSIIDQNAQVVRKIIGEDNVIEHHSNLVLEDDTWRNRVLSENWDAPVVFTTSVQFLNALFAASTNDVRRMHHLANAIIIFDEIQALPIKTVHLFNNAINFLVQSCRTSVVLCTATQPLLHKVCPKHGALRLSSHSDIIPKELRQSKQWCRTQIVDQCKASGGWSNQEVADLAIQQVDSHGSVLVIVNTKKSALELYKLLSNASNAVVHHLSTNMCPAHRKSVIKAIRCSLDSDNPDPIICVSTQLIEAGVDLDFGTVIRYLAGLDSIAQAAGRCNRNGNQVSHAQVWVINPSEEHINKLPDIHKGQEVTRRILDDFCEDPASMDDDLLSQKAMDRFYQYYFSDRSSEMVYLINPKDHPEIGCDTSLLELLSDNETFIKPYERTKGKAPCIPLRQAFASAGKAFRVIDAPTAGVIVPYGEGGRQVIADLVAMDVNSPIEKYKALLRIAQQYSVNLFPEVLKNLLEDGCIDEVQEGSGIYYLGDQYYSDSIGLVYEGALNMTFLNV